MFEGMVDRAFSRANEASISAEEDALAELSDFHSASETTSGLANSAGASPGTSPKR
jgi:hypothetical protein